MNQRVIDGVLVTRPTRADVLDLAAGELAPDVFGRMGPVTEIFGRGISVKGLAYVCYYTRLSETSAISGSMTQDEPVPTIPAGVKWMRTAHYPNW